jgi:hypothetical protein
MARVKSTTCLVGAAAGSSGEGHGSEGLAERMEFVPLSNAGSHSGASGDMDDGSRTWSYFFGPSTMTVSRIRGMINNGYFAEGMDREPR